MSWFDDSDRATLRAIADFLIPAAEGMPSASEVGVDGPGLDRVIGLRGDLAPLLLRAIRFAHGKPPADAAARLRSEDQEAWDALALACAAAYYADTRVGTLLGYTGPERRPLAGHASLVPDTLEHLERVKARGPIWRPVP